MPFSMKIGDAGEAFFVFETEEDIPEDLVTSPILSATSTMSQDEIPSVTLGKSPEVPPVAPKIPEPEFLDLNATLHDRVSTLRKRGQSYSAPQTPPLEVDFPHVPAVSPPDVQYTDGELCYYVCTMMRSPNFDGMIKTWLWTSLDIIPHRRTRTRLRRQDPKFKLPSAVRIPTS